MTPHHTLDELDDLIEELIEQLGGVIGARVYKATQINKVAEDKGQAVRDFIRKREINEALFEAADGTVAGLYLRLLA
jgi:hypothetical protein